MRKSKFKRLVGLALGAEVDKLFMREGERIDGSRIAVYHGAWTPMVHVGIVREKGQKDSAALNAAMPELKHRLLKRAARIEKDLEKIRKELAAD